MVKGYLSRPRRAVEGPRIELPAMRSHEIRRRFLDHFAASGHAQLPSGSLVPPDWDRSVLITTAGMQPLKRYFLGLEEPPQARLMTVQKCFRTVDIDEVGRTAHHLTFFEMLGNFSIGDYFKKFAVEQAWELVTSPDGFGFDPDKLWATVYRGDGDVPADEEAIALWLEVGVPPERILRLGGDNFWQAGPVGPCGPCSELHYDRGEEFGCGRRRVRARLRLRPVHRVLEPRVHAVQHARRRLARAAAAAEHRHRRRARAGDDARPGRRQRVPHRRLRRRHRGRSRAGAAPATATRPSETKALKVLADHGRAMSFLASDGIEPGNEGRGYVLRRVIRRAILFGRRIGLEDAFLVRLHARVVELLRERPPRARPRGGPRRRAARRRGGALLAHARDRRQAAGRRPRRLGRRGLGRRRVPAPRHLRLPDRAHGRDRRRARKAGRRGRLRRAHGRAARPRPGGRRRARASRCPSSTSDFQTEFVGYERLDVDDAGGRASTTQDDGTVLLKLRESPFYPKGGGQVADSGWIETDAARAAVEDVVRVRRRPGDRRPARARRAAPGRARSRPGRRRGPPADDGQPHRDAPAARRAPRPARRPRDAGRLLRRARQAAVRLPPLRPAQRRRSWPTSSGP